MSLDERESSERESKGSQGDANIRSRRNFFSRCAHTLLDPAKALKHSLTEENIDHASRVYLDRGRHYGKTALETACVYLGNQMLGQVLTALHVPHGNPHMRMESLQKKIKTTPIHTVVQMAVTGPAIEETLCRLFPVLLERELTGQPLLPDERPEKLGSWKAGIASSAVFAAIHNIRTENGIRFETSLPIQEFLGGIFLWHLMQNRGFDHCVGAHSAYNVALCLQASFSRKP